MITVNNGDREEKKEKKKKILSIDPSGSGSTGMCFVLFEDHDDDQKKRVYFDIFLSKNWKEHFEFICKTIETEEPNIILFETTNYIKHRMQNSLDLFKLIGAISVLKYCFSFVERVESIAVNQIKGFKDKLQNKKEAIECLEYKIGRGNGWMYEKKRINLHQLDALIIFFLWEKKEKSE